MKKEKTPVLNEQKKDFIKKIWFVELQKQDFIKSIRKQNKENKKGVVYNTIKKEKQNKKRTLENFSIYKNNALQYTWLLENYNGINAREKGINYIQLENLNTLENCINSYASKNSINMLWFIEYKYNNKINDKKYIQNLGKKYTLNELVDLEKVYTYFINAIIEGKNKTKKINKDFIEKKLIREIIKNSKTTYNIEDINKTINEKEIVNINYILEKINKNSNWIIEKLKNHINEFDQKSNEYKKLSRKEKEKEKENYYKTCKKLSIRIKREKEMIKKQYWKLIQN